MTTKADFNAEEWSTLKQAPPLAGLWVSTAEAGGAPSEAMSLAHAYGEARGRMMEHVQVVDLIDLLISEGPELDQSMFNSVSGGLHADAVAQAAPGKLHDATALLQRTASAEELDLYRRFVFELAQHVARAHEEGSHLGVGGRAISDREQAALDGVARALGISSGLSA
jgi:hypothetical protein